MMEHVRKQAELLHASLASHTRMVVLGHTHQLDRTDHYLNLGTWIDHMSGISLSHLAAADTSLPVLKIEDNDQCVVYDARDLTQNCQVSDCRKIY